MKTKCCRKWPKTSDGLRVNEIRCECSEFTFRGRLHNDLAENAGPWVASASLIASKLTSRHHIVAAQCCAQLSTARVFTHRLTFCLRNRYRAHTRHVPPSGSRPNYSPIYRLNGCGGLMKVNKHSSLERRHHHYRRRPVNFLFRLRPPPIANDTQHRNGAPIPCFSQLALIVFMVARAPRYLIRNRCVRQCCHICTTISVLGRITFWFAVSTLKLGSRQKCAKTARKRDWPNRI